MAMSADIMAFTTEYFDNHTAPKHNQDARFHYEAVLAHIGYHPAHMPYTRPALIAALGALCAVFNVVGVIHLAKRRQSKMDSKGKDVSV